MDLTFGELFVAGVCVLIMALQTQLAWKRGWLYHWKQKAIERRKQSLKPKTFASFGEFTYVFCQSMTIGFIVGMVNDGLDVRFIVHTLAILLMVRLIDRKFSTAPPI